MSKKKKETKIEEPQVEVSSNTTETEMDSVTFDSPLDLLEGTIKISDIEKEEFKEINFDGSEEPLMTAAERVNSILPKDKTVEDNSTLKEIKFSNELKPIEKFYKYFVEENKGFPVDMLLNYNPKDSVAYGFKGFKFNNDIIMNNVEYLSFSEDAIVDDFSCPTYDVIKVGSFKIAYFNPGGNKSVNSLFNRRGELIASL